MKVKAKLVVSRMQQQQLFEDLNRLHGFENGLVPLDADPDEEHLEASYQLPRSFGLEFQVEIQLQKDGNLKLIFPVQEEAYAALCARRVHEAYRNHWQCRTQGRRCSYD